MTKSFSLAFPLIRAVHEHQENPHTNGIIRFCQQQLVDRVIVLSVPLFAAFDVLFHVTASIVEASSSTYKSLVYDQTFSLDNALRHLKIAWLFTSVVFTGATYIVNPKKISTIFVNSLTQFLNALLLSGSQDVFINPSNAGGFSSIGDNKAFKKALDIFCTTVSQLPKEIQESMVETLKLVNEAWQFETSREGKASVLSLSSENLFNDIEKKFKSLQAIDGGILNKVFKREIPARFYIFLSAFGELFASHILLLVSIGLILKEICNALLTNQDTDINAHLWKIKLDFITLLRTYIAFPATLIGGLFVPFKIQSVFFSPLYEGDKKLQTETVKLLFKKIEALKPKESTFLPLTTFTEDPSKGNAHAYCIVITKQEMNFRMSIINRGWGADNHDENKSENYANADASFDNVPFETLKEYLNYLVTFQTFEGANALKKHFQEEDLNKAFYCALYYPSMLWQEDEPGITKFTSNHLRSLQKIGNCIIASLMGAISFHSATQTGDMNNKTSYKKFIYTYKKMMFEKYDYLLDFNFQAKANELPSLSAAKQLEKMKTKLARIL